MIYKAKINIMHNGILYPKGSEIELADQDVRGLKAYIERIEAATKETKETKGGKNK